MNVSSTRFVKSTRSDLERKATGITLGICALLMFILLAHVAGPVLRFLGLTS